MNLILGDCREKLKDIENNSIDAVVTDPPYELGILNREWDATGVSFDIKVWEEVLRVLKPGGYLLSFSARNKYHILACKIEEAGFIIKDMLQWVYAQGWPKSKHSLKPAHEPICMAQKPISEKTIIKNIEKWGTGGLNIDGCRIPHNENLETNPSLEKMDTKKRGWGFKKVKRGNEDRYPTNFIITDDLAKKWQRYFYCPKVSPSERKKCLKGIENNHYTVKPIDLIRYLIKLVNPSCGIVLDCFMGSGTAAVACQQLNFGFIGIDIDENNIKLAKHRATNVPKYEADIFDGTQLKI